MFKNLQIVLIIFFFLIVGQEARAQYTTPGNNLNLTFQDLVDLSEGVVTGSDGDYLINNTLVIAATDTLRILEETTIRTAATIRIEVLGKFISDPVQGQVIFTAQDTTSAANNFRGFRFEDADTAVFRNTVVKYGGGIQLIGTEALFEYSVFRNNGSSNVSAAITYSNCSPVIRYCEFRENARSALGSGANVEGSPQIMYSTFIHNTTDNSNRPQINLGPGSSDTLYIVGNHVEGLYPVVGGIAVSNLMGGGSTKAVIADNVIVNNRYGYAQTGNNISTVIRGNTILDNNIQDNPMQGGSGLNFNGITNNNAIVRGNLVSGNLWGVTIQNTAQPDLGTEDDHGGNVFFENGNNGIIYALYNNTPNPINAIGNYWGANSNTTAEEYIVHQPDDSNLGVVTYLPIRELHPVINSFSFLAEVNDALENDVNGIIDTENYQVTVYVPHGTDLTQLTPNISVDLGVTLAPDTDQPLDFSTPVQYTLSVPHGEEQVWTVTVIQQEPEVYTVTFQVTNENDEPVTDAVVTLNGVVNEPGDYVFDNMTPGTYNYTVAKEGFITAEGSLEVVDEDVLVTVTLSTETFTLTFLVNDADAIPITQAVITLNGEEYGAGEYIFDNLLPGIYDYTVAAPGYLTVSGSAEIVDEGIVVDITLELLTYTLTFVVSSEEGNAVADAVITLNGVEYNMGEYVFTGLVPGSYSWQVNADGFHPAQGNAEIVDADVELQVELELSTAISDAAEMPFRIYPNPASHQVTINNPWNTQAEISITTLSGKVMIQSSVPTGAQTLNARQLPEGIYLVRIVAGQNVLVQKLSVVR
ncbi:MAG: T9SS type A sorting domain-containing protein [Bacteroidota bacterium]